MSRDLFQERFETAVANICKVIKGKEDVVRLALVAMLADGHILFEDFPGTGKTMLARAISQTISAEVSRIQCTPDLLPGDVTGSPVLDRKSGDFVFRRGPVFANVFLADEINRATPKTQSALLEAMAEKRVTVDGITHDLPKPFFVLATENPIELAGTFGLPEAQLDRFLFKLSLGYASRDDELSVLKANRTTEAIHSLTPVIGTVEVLEMMTWAAEVSISDPVLYYIIDIVQATRSDGALQMGASSRASQGLMRAARVLAASQGRDDVLPDDVRNLVVPVLNHRLILTPDAMLREETVEGVVERIVNRVKPPLGIGGGSARATRNAATAPVELSVSTA
jgi:MoxR-like ATPase